MGYSKKDAINAMKGIDFQQVTMMLKQFDKNFQTLSENQLYMQENQLEFEKYLKAILQNQENISKKLEECLNHLKK